MKFSVVVLGSLTRILLALRRSSSITCTITLHSTVLCFDILHLGYGYSLLPTLHVLYYFFLVFSEVSVIACLYVTLYYANVSPCSLENFIHSPPETVPGTLSMIGPSRSTHQLQAPRTMSRTHCRRHPRCASVLARTPYFAMLDISCRVS